MTDLPAAIRALPATPPPSLAMVAETPLYLAGYRDGHRAAREAAAGLADARLAGLTSRVTYDVESHDADGDGSEWVPWGREYESPDTARIGTQFASDGESVRVVRVTTHQWVEVIS